MKGIADPFFILGNSPRIIPPVRFPEQVFCFLPHPDLILRVGGLHESVFRQILFQGYIRKRDESFLSQGHALQAGRRKPETAPVSAGGLSLLHFVREQVVGFLTVEHLVGFHKILLHPSITASVQKLQPLFLPDSPPAYFHVQRTGLSRVPPPAAQIQDGVILFRAWNHAGEQLFHCLVKFFHRRKRTVGMHQIAGLEKGVGLFPVKAGGGNNGSRVQLEPAVASFVFQNVIACHDKLFLVFPDIAFIGLKFLCKVPLFDNTATVQDLKHADGICSFIHDWSPSNHWPDPGGSQHFLCLQRTVQSGRPPVSCAFAQPDGQRHLRG